MCLLCLLPLVIVLVECTLFHSRPPRTFLFALRQAPLVRSSAGLKAQTNDVGAETIGLRRAGSKERAPKSALRRANGQARAQPDQEGVGRAAGG